MDVTDPVLLLLFLAVAFCAFFSRLFVAFGQSPADVEKKHLLRVDSFSSRV